MKLTIGKRILMFFHWVLSLLICAAFVAYLIRPDYVTGLYSKVTGKLTATQIMVIGIAILAIYVVLAVIVLCTIFQRRKGTDRGFITVDSSDTGRVRIAVSAIEQMVRQAVISIDGISDMKIAIESQDDAIIINIIATLINGCHVPTVTMNMQQAIRKFVEMNCGVAVRAVSISINAVSNAAEGGRRRGRRGNAEIPPMPAVYPETSPSTSGYAESSAYKPEPEPVKPPVEPIYQAVTEPAPAPAYEAANEPSAEPVSEPEPEEPAYDLPDIEPIKLTLDYSPEVEEAVSDSEAPEALDQD